MKLENNYLSEEELEALIADIEENDLVSAPKDLLNHILQRIEEVPEGESQNNKVMEFRKYCIQVITSVAAAIVLVFLLPTSIQAQKSEIPSKDMIIAKQTVKTKSDVLEDNSKKIEDLEQFLNTMEWFQIFK